MESRLDRLFTLLDSGSNPVIRKSAASQLGEVYKLHPQKLHILLNKILLLMKSTNWDTRIAAGFAVEAVAQRVKQPTCNECVKRELVAKTSVHISPLDNFNIETVLREGASLLSAEEERFEQDSNTAGLDDNERIKKQKSLLNKKLGLDGPVSEGMDLFSEEDLKVTETLVATQKPQRSVTELFEEQMKAGMSVREITMAKRIVKQQLKRQASNITGVENKKMKTMNVAVEQPGQPDKVLLDSVLDNNVADDGWPFEKFCAVLCNELFSKSWETRHGAATLLREIIKVHGNVACSTKTVQDEEGNQLWLEDVAVRLLCVLALDRFGDYVTDEVMAPVRESCAQALGALVNHLRPDSVMKMTNLLTQLLPNPAWEVRYGALLGLKYIIAVRQDLVQDILLSVWPALSAAIYDSTDDVRAVAASCLLPVSSKLSQYLPDQMDSLVGHLWDTLLDLDDLTSSTSSVMSLLAALISTETSSTTKQQENLVKLIPRLWPFLSHNILTVRKASLQTLITVLNQASDLIWFSPLLVVALRHVYQRCLIEGDRAVVDLAEKAWNILVTKSRAEDLVIHCLPLANMWCCLLMQPAPVPIDPSCIIRAEHTTKTSDCRDVNHVTSANSQLKSEFISGDLTEKSHIRDVKVLATRLVCSRCLGRLFARLIAASPVSGYPESSEVLFNLVTFHLDSKSAMQRMGAAFIVSYLAQYAEDYAQLHWDSLKTTVLKCAEEKLYYDEVAASFARLQSECRDFLACLKQQKATLFEHKYPLGIILTIEQIRNVASEDFPQVKDTFRKPVQAKFSERAQLLLQSADQTESEFSLLESRVKLGLASALVSLHHLPVSLNPVIRPLMDIIKKENHPHLLQIASEKLTQVLQMCVYRQPCPNGKVFKNLCIALCSDSKQTPVCNEILYKADDYSGLSCDSKDGILTLFLDGKFSSSTGGNKRGPKPKRQVTEVGTPSDDVIEPQITKPTVSSFQGASSALTTIISSLGENLLEVIPTALDHMINPLSHVTSATAQDIVNCLQLLETTMSSLSAQFRSRILTCMDQLILCMQHYSTAVRHMAARAVSVCALVCREEVMLVIVDKVLPLLEATHEKTWREGAIETIHYIVERLGVACIPYIVLLVVPVLGRMTDQHLSVQMMASQTFASLIKLIPLESGVPDPPDMAKHLVERKVEERHFLNCLFDGKTIENYGIPVPIKAELRRYQQDGVNWLAFLNKYRLHGILCDDMGLGKTLQSICIVSGDQYLRNQRFKETGSVDSVPLPSLVVCPSTLTGHWVYEVNKFVDKEHLSPLNYSVSPVERIKLREKFKEYNLIVASYEIVRNDIDFLKTVDWNYCILDEGHVIKNAKSKTTQAVKQLHCNHRLILSGTPIQNNVLELWSLFDFLMPGYLGTERQFSSKYSRPILQSRDAKSSSKEQEAGALAIESLHRQALPFLLRRLKADVLQDLPPKIIQDYYCELTPLQAELYEEFGETSSGSSVKSSLQLLGSDDTAASDSQGHVFQALQYLKKVCNHPALVVKPGHPKFSTITERLKKSGRSLKSIEQSSKLVALKQLLADCGIGVAQSDDMLVVNEHRALVFCQQKAMLDIIEFQLLKKVLPSVAYLRLDGSVPSNTRYDIVTRFNNDPSIDLLLLTTTVGGLGLNLTGADTVIFVEHDWNPMKDLQAMDRAHRIGQTKVVNVYRLITKNTLEEKIMGLQKFKMNIANTVVNEENTSFATMGTSQVLDLFTLEEMKEKKKEETQGMKAVLQGLTQLWESQEYDDEYNIDSFVESMKSKK